MSWVDEFHVRAIALEQDRDRWRKVASQLLKAHACCELCVEQAVFEYNNAVKDANRCDVW